MTDITKLRALAEAATPGPWTYFEHQLGRRYEAVGVRGADEVAIVRAPCFAEVDNRVITDNQYIAALSPDVVLALLREVEAGRALADAVDIGADDCTPLDVLRKLRKYKAERAVSP